MKLTVISNTFCLAVTGSSDAVTEHNKDSPNKLCNKFHDFIQHKTPLTTIDAVVDECLEIIRTQRKRAINELA